MYSVNGKTCVNSRKSALHYDTRDVNLRPSVFGSLTTCDDERATACSRTPSLLIPLTYPNLLIYALLRGEKNN